MDNKNQSELEKLSFLGFIIVGNTAIRFDHISAVHLDDADQADLTMINGELIKLSFQNTSIFLNQVRQIVAAVQLAQARAQSNILV